MLDFAAADRQMRLLKDLGFLAVGRPTAGECQGSTRISRTPDAMSAAGFQDYSAFVKAIYAEVRKHAAEKGWMPVY